MKNQISFKIRGHRADIGDTTIFRYLPNQYTYHVGHFVFLDYLPPFVRKTRMLPNTGFAHPHRGIATLTYVLHGEAEHFDSRGNHAVIHSGGAQWMKAGNGIIHDESLNADSRTGGMLNHGFQFWINLPAKIKNENPEYMAVQAEEFPVITLGENAGWVKVLMGEYNGLSSKIPCYAHQYLYHIRLNSGKQFSMPMQAGLEYAIFLPEHDLQIGNKTYYAGDLIGFDPNGGSIEIQNLQESEADFLLFGGEPYTEPFVAQGPFVMSSQAEIYQAHNDYMLGKYGTIFYQ